MFNGRRHGRSRLTLLGRCLADLLRAAGQRVRHGTHFVRRRLHAGNQRRQAVPHLVEAARDIAEFVAAGDVDACGQITFREAAPAVDGTYDGLLHGEIQAECQIKADQESRDQACADHYLIRDELTTMRRERRIETVEQGRHHVYRRFNRLGSLCKDLSRRQIEFLGQDRVLYHECRRCMGIPHRHNGILDCSCVSGCVLGDAFHQAFVGSNPVICNLHERAQCDSRFR